MYISIPSLFLMQVTLLIILKIYLLYCNNIFHALNNFFINKHNYTLHGCVVTYFKIIAF